MIVPSKLIPPKESIIFKSTAILEHEFIETPIADLYNDLKHKFVDPREFILALDFLWIAGKIDIDKSRGVLSKC